MPRFNSSWKCADCGITQRKEPHRKLADHMLEAHEKTWDELSNTYIKKKGVTNARIEYRVIDWSKMKSRPTGGPKYTVVTIFPGHLTEEIETATLYNSPYRDLADHFLLEQETKTND